MTTVQFHPDKSSRGDILYSKIKPYLTDGMRILDIGCAYSCMSGLIRNDFPKCQLFGFDSDGRIIEELRQKYPHYRWERILIEQGDELKDYVSTRPDVVIHIGVDSDGWSDIWRVHNFILNVKTVPKYVLLETGRKDGYEKTLETCLKIETMYHNVGYELLDHGQFNFDADEECLRDRRYFVLKKES